MVDLVALAAVVVALQVGFVWAVVDAARRPGYLFQPAIGVSKPATVALIVFTGGIGGLFYLARCRPALVRAAGEIAPHPKPSPDTGSYKEWRRTGDPWA
jgi:hypothetical protein